jgi:hypothetical protein
MATRTVIWLSEQHRPTARLISDPQLDMAMLTFDSIPQARLVRKGGQRFAPPRAPRTRPGPNPVVEQVRSALGVAIGLWPLTTVLLIAFGLLYMAGMSGSP